MATIVKHKSGYRAQVCVKGIRASKILPTKTQAKMWAAEKELEIAGGRTIAATNRTVGDLFDRYCKEVSPGKGGAVWEEKKFKNWEGSLLSKVFVDALNSSHIAAWRDERVKQVKSSTVNRELNLMSAVFTRAIKEWKWLRVNPISEIQRPKNPKHRDRRISEDEIAAVLAALKYDGVVNTQSALVGVYFLFALETAMRLGEICALQETDYFDDYVVVQKSKNGDRRNVALSTRAKELTLLMKGRVVDSDTASTLFRRAVRNAGIEDLTFHDSRHEACTRLARRLDALDLARMIGHRDLKSLLIYYNATASEISKRLG